MIATDSPAIAALKRSTAPGLARNARLARIHRPSKAVELTTARRR